MAAAGRLTSLPAKAREHVTAILTGRDLTQTSLKEVRGELEKRLGVSTGALDACREEIKDITTAEIARLQAEGEGAGEESADDAALTSDSAPTEAAAVAAAVAAKAAAKASSSAAARGKKRAAPAAAEVEQPPAGKAKGKGGTKEKQKNLMSRATFLEKAIGFQATLGDKPMKLPPKVFSTGSCGFWGASKITMDLGGQEVTMQCQVSCTIIGSKEWPES
mmetsp:Transcript_83251/g.211992  ORF Transcript_83251/g.211992 Transcript_83251/m.211992 type:complete len:220 (+) Transcript_83251:56-715(+)